MDTDLPTTMTAMVLTGFGGVERLELRHDVPVPRPGTGEVLIRVAASSVNNTDVNTRIGWYAARPGRPDEDPTPGWSQDAPVFPRIQGADVCGRIVGAGAGVDAARVGQRVLVEPVWRAPGAPLASARYVGSEVDGGFAQYCLAPDRHAHRIESDLTDAELATFPCVGSTAANLVHRAGVGPGDVVVVTGASGGVGSVVVELAKARGATVVAVASPPKAEAVRALGADVVVPDAASLTHAVGEPGADVAVDLVGGPVWPDVVDVLRPGGRYATSGAIGGPVVALDLRRLYLRDLHLIGCTVLDDGVFAGLVAAVEAGAVRPRIAARFPLTDLVAAQEHFLARAQVGKVVIELP